MEMHLSLQAQKQSAKESSTTTGEIIELAKVGEAKKTDRKNIVLWAFYDAADTIFAMAIVSIALYQWGELVGMKAGLTFNRAHIMVSAFLMVSNLLVAILLPILGAHADIMGKRKRTVILLGLAAIVLSAMIPLSNRFILGLIIFTIANIAYQAANLYYESMLPFICDTERRAKVSAFGVAFGYIGTIFAVVLVFVLPMIFGDATKADDVINGIITRENIQLNWVYWMFLFAALFYLLLAIPFLWVKEKSFEGAHQEPFRKKLRSTFVQLGRTFKEIFTENREMLLFLTGWLLINDAVGTGIAILVDYLREGLGMDETIAGATLFVGIIVGILFLYIMGPIIDKRGPRFGIIITATAWVLGICLAIAAGVTYKVSVVNHTVILHKLRFLAYLASAVLSFGMGAVWVVGRQYILELAPTEKIGQYLGFKKISGKVSTAFGPLIFSTILAAAMPFGKTRAYQLAILSLLGFFIIGFVFIIFIKNYHPLYLQGQRYPYKKEKPEELEIKKEKGENSP